MGAPCILLYLKLAGSATIAVSSLGRAEKLTLQKSDMVCLLKNQCVAMGVISRGLVHSDPLPIDTIGHAQGIGNDHSNTLIFQCTLRVRF